MAFYQALWAQFRGVFKDCLAKHFSGLGLARASPRSRNFNRRNFLCADSCRHPSFISQSEQTSTMRLGHWCLLCFFFRLFSPCHEWIAGMRLPYLVASLFWKYQIENCAVMHILEFPFVLCVLHALASTRAIRLIEAFFIFRGEFFVLQHYAFKIVVFLYQTQILI